MHAEEARLGFEVDKGHIFPSLDVFGTIYQNASKSWPEWAKSEEHISSTQNCDRDMIVQGFESGFRNEKLDTVVGEERVKTTIKVQKPSFQELAKSDQDFRAHLLHAHNLAYLTGQRTRIVNWIVE